MDRNIGNAKNSTWFTAFSRLAVGAGAVAAVTAISSMASADIISDAGLTGGPNMVAVIKVLEPGEIVFPAAADDFSAVQVKTGPKVQFGARCKRDGYRCQKVVGNTTAVFDTKHSEEDGEVEANLIAVAYGRDAAKNKAAVVKALQNACKNNQTTVQLPVAVRLTCKKVKFAWGDSSYEVASDAMQATYNITCK